jgi:serine/threonine protein kinase/tetratricopeptide (TPR) repeat protein
MGIVFKAEDIKLQRFVALKFLPESLMRDEEAKARFLREARAAAALNHPNICVIHEVDEANEQSYIAMEYIEGQNLKNKIASGPLRIKEAVLIAAQVALGLAEAHAKGIIHRDIKPANIMLTSKGRAKIMDFGIAKLESGGDLTAPSSLIGTVAYMSPEQARGERLDHRSDIWSLGVVLYEILTGHSPFKRGNEQVTIHALLNEKPLLLATGYSNIPKNVKEIIFKCLQKDPASRFQTADDMVESLNRNISSKEIEGLIDRRGSDKYQVKNRKFLYASALVLIVAILSIGGYFFLAKGKKEVFTGNRRLVILPFENLGPAEDDYFADGMTEEITSRLAKISSLAVISRKSARQYADTNKTIYQIGEELDVDYALGGTVRWARTPDGMGRVKITPKLIQVSSDSYLWAESYERIVEDVFQIQNDIAEKVVDALGITLLDNEQEAVAKRPTDNIKAYQAYLRGRYLAGLPHYTQENWKQVIVRFQQAVALDPGFGLAYAELASAHARFHYLRSDLSEKRLEMARVAAEKAIELAPDSPEVHLAISYYYLWGLRDEKLALQELEKAERFMPDNSEILYAKANRFEILGRFEEGIEALKRAHRISPRDSSIVTMLAGFYWITRQYTEGLEACDQAIALGPEEEWPYFYKILTLWSSKGVTAESRFVVETMPQEGAWAVWFWFWQEVGEGKYEAALERLSASPLEWLRLKTWARPVAMFEAFAYDYMNEKIKARQAYQKSMTMLEAELLKEPDDPRLHSSLGIALAALGMTEQGINEGKKALALYPYAEDAFYGICFVQDLALIYMLAGEYESAMDQVEFLFSIPSWVTISFFDMNPYWTDQYDRPRYKKLVEKYTVKQ